MKVLHGDNQVESRSALDRLLKDHPAEIVRLDGAKAALVDVKQALESVTLFGDTRFVVIDSLLSSVKSRRQQEIADYLLTLPFDNLILWEPKQIKTAFLKKLPSSSVTEFKISSAIFSLLDAILPGNTQAILRHFNAACASDPPELIVFMLLRQLRFLITAKTQLSLLTGPSWLTGRYLTQSRRFRLEELLELHRRLYRLLLDVNTGASPLPLAVSLEIYLSFI